MLSDRELDELVATRLMGWFLVGIARINGRDTSSCWWHESKGDPLDPRGGASAIGFPAYTRDIAAAFDVVEEMRVRGWEFSLLRAAPQVHRWVAAFSRTRPTMGGPSQASAHDAHSIPRAICIAALKAIGVDATQATLMTRPFLAAYLWHGPRRPNDRPLGIYCGERLIREVASVGVRDAIIAAHNRYVREEAVVAADLDDDSEDALGPQGLGPVEEIEP